MGRTMKRLMVERIINIADDGSLGFDNIEQRIATLEVDNPDEWTAEQLVEMAYSEANMKPRSDEHRITALGKSMEVSDE